MNFIQNFVLRALGLGKAVDALDGETSKAYLGGVGLILTGLASLAGGVAHVATAIVAAHGGPEYLAIGRALYAGNADTALLLAGLGMVSKGWAEIGQRHALAKSDAAAAVPPAQPPA